MESDDSPGDGRPDPDGESEHANRRTDGETSADPARPDESVPDQWHSDPPEGWSEDKDGDVFGAGPREGDEPPPIEPGDPSLENALFVLLGVLTSVGLLLHVVTSF